jgi:eukaryotic-like serine/threonine-protein kinase
MLREESLEIAKRFHSTFGAALLHSGLAETSLEEERPSEAGNMATISMQEAQAAGEVTWVNDAHALLAQALLVQGQIPEAKKEIEQALSHVAEIQWWHRMRILVIAARVRDASGETADIAEATKDLRAILDEARKKNAPQIQFEARLALGEIELASGNPEAGRAGLMTLAKDARAKGFLLIARKASSALPKHS